MGLGVRNTKASISKLKKIILAKAGLIYRFTGSFFAQGGTCGLASFSAVQRMILAGPQVCAVQQQQCREMCRSGSMLSPLGVKAFLLLPTLTLPTTFCPSCCSSMPVLTGQALRHPWVLDGRLYSGSGGSSSDGSDFSAGGAGGGVEEDWRAPDPQNIPSELLGADSDTEDEEEPTNNGSREWKESSDMGLHHRPGYTPAVAQPPPPPPPRPVVVVPTPTEKQSASSVGRKGVGVGPAKEMPAKTKPPSTTAEVSVELRGIREEGEGPAGSSTRLGGRGSAREGQGHPDAAAAGGGGGDRQASKTTPAPRPAPPPTTAGDANPVPSTEANEDNAGRGRKQQPSSGEHVASRSSGEEEKAVTPKGEGGVGGGDGKEVELETAGGGGRQVLPARRVRVATEVAVAAEAGKEGAAKEAQMAAITVVTTTPSAATAATAAASPPLPPRPPLAPVEMTDPFTTPPRKLRSPRPLDAFSSPPLAPVGSGRAVEEEESEFSLDAGPALPPEKGRARSREGLPPAGPGHARSRGENSSAFSLGMVERQLSMGVAGISIMEAAGQAEKREGVVAAAAAPPPAFHDLVKRSTRFMTSGEQRSRMEVLLPLVSV